MSVERLVEAALKPDLPQARALLQAEPGLLDRSFAVALVTGHAGHVRSHLATDPALATKPAPPRNMPPLLMCTRTAFARPGEPKPAPGCGEFAACVQVLVEAGADVNVRVPFDPPHQASAGSPLYYAAGYHGNVDLGRALLSAGANVHDGETLYHSVEHGNPALLRLVHPYVTDMGDWSYAFIHLMDFNFPQSVRTMLELGVDLTHRHPGTGETALHWALRHHRDAAIVTALLEAGADPALTDGHGLTAYQWAVRSGDVASAALFERYGHRPGLDPLSRLMLAAGLNDVEAVATLRAQHPGLSPGPADHLVLHRVAAAGRSRVLDGLIRHGGLDPSAADVNGQTALHLAAIEGHVDAARVLIHAGAPLDSRDRHHHSDPIGWACWGSLYRNGPAKPQAYAAIVDQLLTAGGTVPETAWGSPEVRAVLVRFGAAKAAAK